MSNTQLLLTIGIPSVLVILSWISNNNRLSAVESDMKELRGDIKQFYRTLGKHDEAIDTLKAQS